MGKRMVWECFVRSGVLWRSEQLVCHHMDGADDVVGTLSLCGMFLNWRSKFTKALKELPFLPLIESFLEHASLSTYYAPGALLCPGDVGIS